MSYRVKIRHFQSLRSVDLEISGFTVITGSSNTGKSAVVRAISSALFGALGDYYITDRPEPEDQCAVAVVTDNASVQWWKVRDGKATPEKSTSLKVNGTKYTKFGKEQAELTKDLGFIELSIAGQKIRPQIAGQFDNIFLLSGSETEAAEVLRLLGRVDLITEAQRLATKDTRETAVRLKVRKEDCLAAKVKVVELDWLGDKRTQFELLLMEWSRINQEIHQREQLKAEVEEAQQIQPKEIPPEFTENNIPPLTRILQKVREALVLKKTELPKKLDFAPLPRRMFQRNLVVDAMEAMGDLETIQHQVYMRKVALSLLCEQKREMERELGVCPVCSRPFESSGMVV